jgi:hypothetical protein
MTDERQNRSSGSGADQETGPQTVVEGAQPSNETVLEKNPGLLDDDRDKRGRFKPGRSGNPKGRRSLDADVTELAKAHTEEAIERLVHWMRSSDAKASITAAIALLNRGWGKPTQVAELNNNGAPLVSVSIGGTNVDPRALSHEALMQLGTDEVLRLARDGRLDADALLAVAEARARRPAIEHRADVGSVPAPIVAQEPLRAADDQEHEAPDNVVQLGTRIDQDPAV